MAIKDLEVKQSNVDIVVEVVDIGEVREFQKFGRPGRVATATVKDDTGEIKLTLWNDEIDKVKKGDKVHIENGYVNEWQGEKQLTTGRFGKLEVISNGDETIDEATEEELLNEKPSDEGEHILTEDEKEEADLVNKDIKEEPVEEEVTSDELEEDKITKSE